MVADGLTEIELPVPADVPPQLAVYQCQLAPVPKDPPDTVRVTLSPGQMLVEEAVMEVGAVELELTVIVMVEEVAGFPVVQPSELVNTQYT